MNKLALTDVSILIDGVNVSSMTRHFEMISNADVIDVSCYGTRWKISRIGVPGVEVTMELFFDTASPVSFDSLFGASSSAVVQVSPRSSPVAPGNPLFAVPCKVSSWQPMGGDVGQPATLLLTFGSAGTLTRT